MTCPNGAIGQQKNFKTAVYAPCRATKLRLVTSIRVWWAYYHIHGVAGRENTKGHLQSFLNHTGQLSQASTILPKSGLSFAGSSTQWSVISTDKLSDYFKIIGYWLRVNDPFKSKISIQWQIHCNKSGNFSSYTNDKV